MAEAMKRAVRKAATIVSLERLKLAQTSLSKKRPAHVVGGECGAGAA
jgi:hypothetical protein